MSLSEPILESSPHPSSATRGANPALHPFAPVPAPSGSRGLVVIVDDDSVTARVLQRTLELAAYEVRAFGSVESLFQALHDLHPKAICLDVMLPGMTGLQALPLLKQKLPTTSVLMVSSETNVDGVVNAMQHGAFDYLLKPVDRDVFAAAVTRAVAKSQLHGELVELERRLTALGFALRSAHEEQLAGLLSGVAAAAHGKSHLILRSDNSTARLAVARAVHGASPRHRAPFVEIDAGDPATAGQAKSFLAGLALGPGNDPANVAVLGGTLYLDRIEQLGKEEQAMLHGVLAGYGKGTKGLRVIAASACDLKAEANAGRLSPDLYLQLAADELSLPALAKSNGGASSGASSPEVQTLFANPMTLDDLERLAIEAALQRSRGNVTRAMRQLGIGRTTLYRKLKRYNLR